MATPNLSSPVALKRYWRRVWSRLGRHRGAATTLIGAIAALSAVVIVDATFPPPLEKAEAVSVIVRDRDGEWLHAFATPEGRWRLPARVSELDPTFVDRLVAIEDKRFFQHWGVDPSAVGRALLDLFVEGRVVSGASTITMQTARLLEPRPRTLPSKLIEAFRALQMERRLTKEEILELYLTLAPYGGNIEGVRAASLIYFDKEPAGLSLAEQALLIALPQAPEARRPDRRPAVAAASRQVMLERLVERELIEPNRAREAAFEPTPQRRHAMPKRAYHASRRLSLARVEASAALDAAGGERRDFIRSTLSAPVQIIAERLVAAHVKGAEDSAIAAAMIVDVATGDVLASVGSSSLSAPGGWIDMTRAVRSPGSLLKPFIYGLAADDGLVGPDTILSDAPRAFAGYRPENFDRRYRGEVRVREALQHSLNVPAVATLDRVGAARFGAVLGAAGAPLRLPARPSGEIGLATGLGGAGLTMENVAALYAGLARGGVVKPLNWRGDGINPDAAQRRYRILSPASARRLAAILRGAPSLAGRAPSILSASAPVVAYKTGTSYGYRDAWAAGFADGRAIVVWVGRADGAPRPGQTGRKAAAPLLFSLFDALAAPQRAEGLADEPPEPLWGARTVSAALRSSGPTIEFPRDGAELLFQSTHAGEKGYALSASGGAAPYRWYLDGAAMPPERDVGARRAQRPVWRPVAPGFYALTVVDADGASAQATVRVVSGP